MMDFREIPPEKYPVITLAPGQGVIVRLHESDGEIVCEYKDNSFSVTADLEDGDGRNGVIYEEFFYEPEVNGVSK